MSDETRGDFLGKLVGTKESEFPRESDVDVITSIYFSNKSADLATCSSISLGEGGVLLISYPPSFFESLQQTLIAIHRGENITVVNGQSDRETLVAAAKRASAVLFASEDQKSQQSKKSPVIILRNLAALAKMVKDESDQTVIEMLARVDSTYRNENLLFKPMVFIEGMIEDVKKLGEGANIGLAETFRSRGRITFPLTSEQEMKELVANLCRGIRTVVAHKLSRERQSLATILFVPDSYLDLATEAVEFLLRKGLIKKSIKPSEVIFTERRREITKMAADLNWILLIVNYSWLEESELEQLEQTGRRSLIITGRALIEPEKLVRIERYGFSQEGKLIERSN